MLIRLLISKTIASLGYTDFDITEVEKLGWKASNT